MYANFKYIFVKENLSILIEILLKFVPKCAIRNNWTLVQIVVWCQENSVITIVADALALLLPGHH